MAAVLLLLVMSVPMGFFLHSVSAGQEAALPVPEQRDVTYCVADGVPLKMDIYEPIKADSAPAPVAMFVHGGSWSGGDKASYEGAHEIAALVSRGYLVASVNYRLAPQYVFPAQIEDVKCAVRYLRAGASSLNIDPNRIGAWGTSAGGQLVSLLGTTDESAGLEGNGGYADVSSRVQAVVDMYGRADLATIPETRPDLLPVFGGEANLSRYSPVTYASKDDPPFLIMHGDQDNVVPPELSQEFYDRLTAAGVQATLVMVSHAGHGFVPTGPGMSPSRAEITGMVGDFFDRHLKGVTTPATAPRRVVRAASLPAGGDAVECTQTGKTMRGAFYSYWKSHGGVAQQGYPISGELQEVSPVDGKPYTVQYFERAVFEYHPENHPPYQVLPALLGAQRYRARYPNGAHGQQPNYAQDSMLFEQTGHRVGGVFLRYWQQHGGVMQQGYPVSDELMETSSMDGKPYLVQYFERAVFEYHPENDQANQVLLAQLGTLEYKAEYGTGARGQVTGFHPGN
jgi:acetyl esterase/lipase